jgi:hypothetical protein
MSHRPGGPVRGWLSLYVAAFVLLLLAGAFVAMAARDFLSNLSLLWISIACSAGAVVVAIVSVVLPRRG